jgi:pimeloyl-ACP methyl ester carboxylesterase
MDRHPIPVRTGSLAVSGARLHYKCTGAGPVLLVLQGGDGDADSTDQLVQHLADHYTVLTYDRRGLSRSRIPEPDAPIDLTVHSRDASELLEAITDEPVFVFGTSIGALIGLDLICRHPGQVRLLIAHEPPAPHLLAEAERRRAVADQEQIEALHRESGLREAMMKFIAIAPIRFDDREHDVELPRPAPERIGNLDFFLTHDAPAVRRYRLDLPALRTVAGRIVPAGGESAEGDGFPRHCAAMLAAALERPFAGFPGGHTAPVLRPRAFAERLHRALQDAA